MAHDTADDGEYVTLAPMANGREAARPILVLPAFRVRASLLGPPDKPVNP
jgi:hypothetical protein